MVQTPTRSYVRKSHKIRDIQPSAERKAKLDVRSHGQILPRAESWNLKGCVKSAFVTNLLLMVFELDFVDKPLTCLGLEF